jgi:neocarzinostatin family protein/carboxypeptidase family protein
MRSTLRLVIAVVVTVGSFAGSAGAATAQTTRTLTVTPDTGLHDRDTVTLHGTGFTPSEDVFTCEGIVVSSPDPSDCGTSPVSTRANAAGEFTATFTVQRFISSAAHGDVDCAQADANCGIGAADFFSSGGGAVATPITFVAQPPVVLGISGTVTGPGATPLSGVKVWAYTNSDAFVATRQTVTGTDGKYALDDLDPHVEYRVRFGPPSGSNLAPEWWNNQFNRRTADAVQLSFTAPTATLDAELGSAGSVSGTVTGATGAPISGVKVYAYAPWDRWVGSYVATTGADGSYTIEGAWPASDYRVRFVPVTGSDLAPEWFDNQPTATTAARFAVTAGVTTTDVNAELAAP